MHLFDDVWCKHLFEIYMNRMITLPINHSSKQGLAFSSGDCSEDVALERYVAKSLKLWSHLRRQTLVCGEIRILHVLAVKGIQKCWWLMYIWWCLNLNVHVVSVESISIVSGWPCSLWRNSASKSRSEKLQGLKDSMEKKPADTHEETDDDMWNKASRTTHGFHV